MTPEPSGARRRRQPLACGADFNDLVAQVADGLPGDSAHQAACPHCQAALAELERLWALMGELATERVAAPERIDVVVLGRIQRALFLGAVANLVGGVLPRLVRAFLTYAGLAAPPSGRA